jgi:hypothetical protein
MKTLFLFTAAGMGISLCASLALGADDARPAGATIVRIATLEKVDQSVWYLQLINGDLGFWANTRGQASEPNPPSIPIDAGGYSRQNNHFVKVGAMLRVSLSPEERKRSKEQAAKDRGYLTGDYSTKLPRVILTKEPTKYSRWTFVHIDGNIHHDGEECYIKNDNDLGKDAWLSLEDKGVHYTGGEEVRRPTLSFEKKLRFFVEDVNIGK